MAFVYWVRKSTHSDILSEGYIGITNKSVEYRLMQHKYLAKTGAKSALYSAMRKYGDELVVQTLVQAEEDYCLDLEQS